MTRPPDHPPEEPVSDWLPLVAETARVVAERRVTSVVRLDVRTEQFDEPVTADLATEEVEVTRVPIGREVTEVPQTRVEGEVTIIPVLEERLVVETRLYLREEVHLRRRRRVDQVTTVVPLRRQTAEVRHHPAGPAPGDATTGGASEQTAERSAETPERKDEQDD